MYLMNSPADSDSANFGDLEPMPMEADLDLFDFSDDVFEIEGSSDGPDDMHHVQMEDNTQPEMETHLQRLRQRSLCSSFNCDASQASLQQYSEADLYHGALEKLAESMKRTEESRRYVLKIQREVLTESQEGALFVAR